MSLLSFNDYSHFFNENNNKYTLILGGNRKKEATNIKTIST